MKKSEVIRDLAIFLMGRLPEWQKTERLKFADEIINELEIIGMQPPFRDEDSINNKDYFTLHVDQAAYIGVCEWEPEE